MAKFGQMLRCCTRRLLELGLVFFAVVYMPGLPPNGSFTANTIVPSKPLADEYSLNNALNNVEHLYDNQLRGPECFAEWKGELYASVHGGEVVKLSKDGGITHVTKVGKPCEGYHQESKCGRPLGIAFDASGALYVTDAYFGIWKVNVQNGKKELLVSPDVEIEGRKPTLFNSIALASNGDFYWTDSSDTPLENGVFGMLLDGSGRLFHYNAATKKSSVLLDGLWFANGVALSPNEEFVVVSETARSQLRRYYLKGSKKGTDDIFIDGLPGLPDNLKSIQNGLLVPLVAPRDDSHPVIFQSLAPHPLIRKFLARLLALVELPFIAAQRVVPHYVFEKAIHWIGHFESVQSLVPKRTTIVKMDWNGNVLECWHNVDGSLSGISEAHIFQNKLYLGSPYNTYVGRSAIPMVAPAIKAESQAPRQAAPPKPTPGPAPKVTTPKPTAAPTPKPTAAPKPAVTQPPPTQAPPPKPTQAPAPKQTPPKPTQAPPKPTQAPPKATQPPPKQNQPPPPKPTQPPKPAQAPKLAQAPKPAEAKPEAQKPIPQQAQKPREPVQPRADPKVPAIPITEEIPSDTKPPKKENLKIISRDGPAEMPLPEGKAQKPRAQPAPKAAAHNEL